MVGTEMKYAIDMNFTRSTLYIKPLRIPAGIPRMISYFQTNQDPHKPSLSIRILDRRGLQHRSSFDGKMPI